MTSPSETALAVIRARLTYLSPEKLARLEAAVRQVDAAGVAGAVVECGVALGGSGIVLATAAMVRPYIGLDVFGRLPEQYSEEDGDQRRARYETIRSGQSTGIAGEAYYGYRDDLLTEVMASFARFGVPADGTRVQLLPGRFDQTLPTIDLPVAVAHIDCDWFEPMKFCLTEIAARMPAGGIMVVDDYPDFQGTRRAVDQFLSKHSDFEFAPGANAYLRRRN